MARLRGAATTTTAEVSPPEGALARSFPQTVLPGFAPSKAEPAAQVSSAFLSPRTRLARRTTDARRRRSGPFVGRGEPHPEAHASRSRPILLIQVPPGSAAARAGPREGDVLVKYGDSDLAGAEERVAALQKAAQAPGAPASARRTNSGGTGSGAWCGSAPVAQWSEAAGIGPPWAMALVHGLS